MVLVMLPKPVPQCLEMLRGGYAGEELVEFNVVNLEEILPESNQWGYTGPKHAFRLEELRVDEEAFEKIVAKFSHPLNAFLKGVGPLVAPNHVISGEDTIFFGALRGFLLHFPIDDANAIALLEEAVEKHHSMEWWLKTPYAIVSISSSRIIQFDIDIFVVPSRYLRGRHRQGR